MTEEGDAADAVLELWIDAAPGRSLARLRCVGLLDRTTRTAVLSALHEMVCSGAPVLAVDVGRLQVTDPVGGETLRAMDRIAGRAGRMLSWQGRPPQVVAGGGSAA